MRKRIETPWIIAALLLAHTLTAGAHLQELPSGRLLDDIRHYIKASWTTLTRSAKDLPAAARDPKLPRKPGEPWPVYLSPKENRARLARELQGALSDTELAEI